MTLIDSVGPIVTKSEMVLALERGENPLLLEHADDLDRMIDFVLEKKPPRLPRAVRRYIGQDRFDRRDAHALLFRGWIDSNDGEGVPTDLASLHTPALVIHGTRDRVIDVSTGEALAAQLPDARLDLMDGIGHVPQMEAPGYVAKRVGDFIDEVERARAQDDSSARPC
jgi:abhydrolase domain-containing protein 6